MLRHQQEQEQAHLELARLAGRPWWWVLQERHVRTMPILSDVLGILASIRREEGFNDVHMRHA